MVKATFTATDFRATRAAHLEFTKNHEALMLAINNNTALAKLPPAFEKFRSSLGDVIANEPVYQRALAALTDATRLDLDQSKLIFDLQAEVTSLLGLVTNSTTAVADGISSVVPAA